MDGGDRSLERRIGELLPEGQRLDSVFPDDSLGCATSIMSDKNYSQLPVISEGGKVEGIITWESIGHRASDGTNCKLVCECMEPSENVRTARFDAPLLDSTKNIANYGYVLVMEDDTKVRGIVTASDIAEEFRRLAEGFLAIEEIEGHLRRLVDDKFTDDEKQTANKDWEPGDGITLGHYYYLLKSQDNWHKLKLDVCHETFLEDLNSVREIRNRYMHFDSRELEPEDLEKLRGFRDLLRELS